MSGLRVTVATCALNQWATDSKGNLRRVKKSIVQAKEAGATLRVGPELELAGYGCLDHFLEDETYDTCLNSLYDILTDESLHGIIIDVGLPIKHRNVRFNARALCLNGKILGFRPKLYLANDGIFRELRHFSSWNRTKYVEEYHFDQERFRKLQGKNSVPIGDFVIDTLDTCFAAETCEELFTPNPPHIDMGLDGVEIFTNSSGSHHSLRKFGERYSLIHEATVKNGGIYLYSNQIGCDGDRLYYDGCAMIFVNGDLVACGSQFSLNEVEVITATVDLGKVRNHRSASSRNQQAVQGGRKHYDRLQVDFALSSNDIGVALTPTIVAKPHTPEEEIAYGPACWLWDYLRRSGAAGFFVPLSGGIDSCATATIVFSMCRIVIRAIEEGNQVVIDDVRRIATFSPVNPKTGLRELPKTPETLCNQIFYTCYMGMKNQSSKETRQRAKDLAKKIGSYHTDINIDDTFNATKNLLPEATGFMPKFKVHGGSHTSNLALQNIQARSRMVIAYYFALTLPEVRSRPGGRSCLVLGSSNVDECLRGYLTKYDCSSADINPIGGISKTDLKSFIAWAAVDFKLPILEEFINATPTAELEPITENYVQSDEADMGMTYAELSEFGILRKVNRLGAFRMFLHLQPKWAQERGLTPSKVAEKVKHFFHNFQINRHKQTVATPAYHAESYSPDDHRFDHRPFLYPPAYGSSAFDQIDEHVAALEKRAEERGGK